jgi:hypothetical protein
MLTLPMSTSPRFLLTQSCLTAYVCASCSVYIAEIIEIIAHVTGDRSNAFHKGDVLVYVNGITLAGKSPEEVKGILMHVWADAKAAVLFRYGVCVG